MKTIEQQKGINDTCATIRIACEPTDQNPAGFIVIDEDDFDPDQHVEFVEGMHELMADAAATEAAKKAADDAVAQLAAATDDAAKAAAQKDLEAKQAAADAAAAKEAAAKAAAAKEDVVKANKRK